MLVSVYLHNFVKYKHSYELQGKQIKSIECGKDVIPEIVKGIAVGISYRNSNRFAVVAKKGNEVVCYHEVEFSSKRDKILNLGAADF